MATNLLTSTVLLQGNADKLIMGVYLVRQENFATIDEIWQKWDTGSFRWLLSCENVGTSNSCYGDQDIWLEEVKWSWTDPFSSVSGPANFQYILLLALSSTWQVVSWLHSLHTHLSLSQHHLDRSYGWTDSHQILPTCSLSCSPFFCIRTIHHHSP